MENSGQSCNAPTRMLVPFRRLEEYSHIEGTGIVYGSSVHRGQSTAENTLARMISKSSSTCDDETIVIFA